MAAAAAAGKAGCDASTYQLRFATFHRIDWFGRRSRPHAVRPFRPAAAAAGDLAALGPLIKISDFAGCLILRRRFWEAAMLAAMAWDKEMVEGLGGTPSRRDDPRHGEARRAESCYETQQASANYPPVI